MDSITDLIEQELTINTMEYPEEQENENSIMDALNLLKIIQQISICLKRILLLIAETKKCKAVNIMIPRIWIQS